MPIAGRIPRGKADEQSRSHENDSDHRRPPRQDRQPETALLHDIRSSRRPGTRRLEVRPRPFLIVPTGHAAKINPYGDALAAPGARRDVVAMDGEVSNSTYADQFAKEHPGRYFEMYIAEQQMVAAAVGFSVRGYRPFASTFAAFLTRAYDFIRMAAISQADISLAGSHAGVEIGADGPSQMALEDLAMLRAVHDSTVLYPSDATSTAALVRAMADRTGVSYLRTTRGAYPVLYDAAETFPIGGSKVVRSADDDQVTLIGAGVTLHACLAAADQLTEHGISARVIDLYSIKPIDTATLAAAAEATGGRSPTWRCPSCRARGPARNCSMPPGSPPGTSPPPRASWSTRPEPERRAEPGSGPDPGSRARVFPAQAQRRQRGSAIHYLRQQMMCERAASAGPPGSRRGSPRPRAMQARNRSRETYAHVTRGKVRCSAGLTWRKLLPGSATRSPKSERVNIRITSPICVTLRSASARLPLSMSLTTSVAPASASVQTTGPPTNRRACSRLPGVCAVATSHPLGR